MFHSNERIERTCNDIIDDIIGDIWENCQTNNNGLTEFGSQVLNIATDIKGGTNLASAIEYCENNQSLIYCQSLKKLAEIKQIN